jgi:hypothetical protein
MRIVLNTVRPQALIHFRISTLQRLENGNRRPVSRRQRPLSTRDELHPCKATQQTVSRACSRKQRRYDCQEGSHSEFRRNCFARYMFWRTFSTAEMPRQTGDSGEFGKEVPEYKGNTDFLDAKSSTTIHFVIAVLEEPCTRGESRTEDARLAGAEGGGEFCRIPTKDTSCGSAFSCHGKTSVPAPLQ